ncbi:MAG: zinc-ribbon domain-containing protein [Bacilli bacterium]|nr:zinc-ribbon domain-containing protein [Bacilli bacterium]
MKCPNCGNELVEREKICAECGLNVEEITTPLEIKEKKTKGIIIAVLALLAVIALAVILVFTYSNNKENDKKDDINNEEEKSENTIAFMNYTLTVPDDFLYSVNEGSSYIQNDEFYAMFVDYPLSVSDVVDHKDVFINELTSQNYIVNSYNTKQVNGKNYFLVNGKYNNLEFGYLLGDFDANTHYCFTIVSSELKKFNEGWYDAIIAFTETARK